MMKKIITYLSAPILAAVAVAMQLFFTEGGIVIALLLFRDLILPIVYFAVVKNCFKNDGGRLQCSATAPILVMSGTVVLYTLLVDVILYESGNFAVNLILRLTWAILCGYMILTDSSAAEGEALSNADKATLIAGGATVLIVNALTTRFLAPSLSRALHAEAIEIIMLPTTAVLVAVYSYKLGKKISSNHSKIKMLIWAVCVLASEFAALWLLNFMTEPIMWFVWAIVSAIIFAPCVIAFAIHGRKASAV